MYIFKCKYQVYKTPTKYYKIYLRGDNVFKVEKEEFTNKTFRMPNKLVEQLQSVAQEQGVSLNKLVVQCCQYALENLEK